MEDCRNKEYCYNDDFYNQSKTSLQMMSLVAPTPKRMRPSKENPSFHNYCEETPIQEITRDCPNIGTGETDPYYNSLHQRFPHDDYYNQENSMEYYHKESKGLTSIDEHEDVKLQKENSMEGFVMRSCISSFNLRHKSKDYSPTDVSELPLSTPVKKDGNMGRLSFSNCSRFENDFQKVREIGKGSFGTVYEVLGKLDNGKYAVKVSNKALKDNTTERKKMLQEVVSLAKVNASENCIHIVRYYQAWLDESRLFIQMELCEETLESKIAMKSFTDAEVWKLLRHMLLALQMLHSHDMVHLDIKPGNIVIKNQIYKLADFGLVLTLKNHQKTDIEEGDCRYMAKELLNEGEKDLKKCDIFSLGITAYQICSYPIRKLPPNGEEWHEIRSNSRKFCTLVSPKLEHVTTCMMDENPQLRPSADALLSQEEHLQGEVERQLSCAKKELQEYRADANVKRIVSQEKKLARWSTVG